MSYREFWYEQGEWSQNTFGPDQIRGPQGPLLHLYKELTTELLEMDPCGNHHNLDPRLTKDQLHMEIVDCFFLVTDAARRSGMSYDEFMAMAFKKLEINKNRKWQKPTTDQPVEHDRSQEK